MQKFDDGYLFTDEKDLVNLDTVFNLLKETYWAKDRSIEIVKKSIENSICFSILLSGRQIGFARAISDESTYTAILDLVIDKDFRAMGLGKKLLEFIINNPKIKNTKKILWTKDSEKLYEKYGFSEDINMKVLFQKP